MSSTEPYINDSLRWVAVEVRYPPVEELAVGVPTAFRDRVHDDFPILEPQTQFALSIGPAAPIPQQSFAHRFLRRDRLMSVMVSHDAAVLEATIYKGWTDFLDTFLSTLKALQESVALEGIVRIGLRYIDEIRVPAPHASLRSWSDWINERLIGPILLDDESEPANCTIAIQYGEPPGYVTLFRAAPFSSGRAVQEQGPLRMPISTPDGPYFLLDTDASWADPDRTIPEFDVDNIRDILARLHSSCIRLYEASITPKLRTEILERPREEEVYGS